MIPIASNKTKEINKFVYVPIPSPRDYFSRYGARLDNKGLYLSDGSSDFALHDGGSTIDSLVRAQRYLENKSNKDNV